MTYELAKELKDAGFPQGKISMELVRAFAYFKQEPAYYPILEELIEACGDNLFSVGRLRSGGWGAYSGMWGEEKPYASGLTSTEAVARLWLALNAKDGDC